MTSYVLSPKFLAPVLLTFFSALFFQNELFSYFSQDDFFHLRVVMDRSFSEIINFFISKPTEYGFFRPLSRELYNFFMYRIFGLNPLAFHLINFLLIIVNLGFIFIMIKKLKLTYINYFFIMIVYLFSAIHSVEFYYLSSIQILLASSFMLLSIISYIYFLPKRSAIPFLFSILFFILALFCHESSIVLPVILFTYNFIFIKMPLSVLVFRIIPFILISISYFYFGFNFSVIPEQEVYQPVFSVKSIINNLSWYLLWSFGIPEMLVDFIGPKFTVNQNLFKWYGDYVKIIFPMLIFMGTMFLLSIIGINKRIIKEKILIISFLNFFITLSPFLLFPQHKFIYYLISPQIWFALSLGIILSITWNKKGIFRWVVLGFIVSFIIISYNTTKINEITYWAAKRAVAAEYILNDLAIRYPKVDSGTIFFIQDDPKYPVIAEEWGTSSKQAFYILSGKDAFQLFYRDPTIKVYYQAFDQTPKFNSQNKIILYTAKFPY